MGLIVFLVLLGMFFLVVELVLLPGTTVGTVLSLLCYGTAAYFGFARYDVVGGGVTIAAILVVSLIATVISLRAKTWQRFSLDQKIESSSMASPADELKTGDRGTTVSRLSPIGKVNIDGKVYEAKSADGFIDQRKRVEVTGFENFTVVVKLAE